MCGRTAVYSYNWAGIKRYLCADHMKTAQLACDHYGVKLDVRSYTGKEKCIDLKGEKKT